MSEDFPGVQRPVRYTPGMRIWTAGIPILAIVATGSVLLTFVMQDKFDRHKLRNQGRVKPPDLEVANERKLLKEPVTFDLDTELKRMEQKLDLEDWKQVRIPRIKNLDDDDSAPPSAKAESRR